MVKYSLLQTDVILNGKRVALPGDVSFDVDPNEVEIVTVDSVYPKSLYLTPTGSGSVTFRAPADMYANSPVDILDALGFRGGYFGFNKTTELITYVEGPYGLFDEPDPTYGVPIIPNEVRQLEETGAQVVIVGGAYEKVAMKFRANGSKLKNLMFLARNATAEATNDITLEIFSDSAGSPNAIVGVSTLTLTVHFGTGTDSGTDVYTGAALATGGTYASATWQEVSFETVDILDGELLTVGEDYWVVFTANAGEHGVYFNHSSHSNLESSDVKFHTGTAWADVSTATDPCFVVGSYNDTGGDVIVFRSWNSDKSEGIQWTFGASKVRIGSPQIDPKKDIEVTVTFKSNIVTGPTSL